jgi:hypothetical protein
MLFGYCQAAHCNVKLASIGVLFYDVKVSSAPTLLTLNGCALDANGHLTLVGSGESVPVFFLFFFWQNNYDRFWIQLHLVLAWCFCLMDTPEYLYKLLWSIWDFILVF